MHLTRFVTPMKTKKQTTILALSVFLFCAMGEDSEGKDTGRQNEKPNVLFIAIHGQAGCQRDAIYQRALLGSGLRSFKVCPDERDPSFDIG